MGRLAIGWIKLPDRNMFGCSSKVVGSIPTLPTMAHYWMREAVPGQSIVLVQTQERFLKGECRLNPPVQKGYSRVVRFLPLVCWIGW